MAQPSIFYLLGLATRVKMFLVPTSNSRRILLELGIGFRSPFRCIPQNCTFGEKFNAFYGRCEKMLCQPGYNVTTLGKCIGESKTNCAIFADIEYIQISTNALKSPVHVKIGERCDNTPGSYRCVQTFACANGLEMKDLQCLGRRETKPCMSMRGRC